MSAQAQGLQLDERARIAPFDWWISFLQTRAAAGDDPLFVLCGCAGIWGLWAALAWMPPLDELGRLLDHGEVPTWAKGPGFGISDPACDPLYPMLVLSALIESDRVGFRSGKPCGFLFGPLRARQPPAPNFLHALWGAERALRLWEDHQNLRAADDPRLVLVFRGGTWRLWISLDDRRGLDEILPLIAAEGPELTRRPVVADNARLRFDAFSVSEHRSPERLLRDALDMRDRGAPWVCVQVPAWGPLGDDWEKPGQDIPF